MKFGRCSNELEIAIVNVILMYFSVVYFDVYFDVFLLNFYFNIFDLSAPPRLKSIIYLLQFYKCYLSKPLTVITH